jgi:hypothetical protein
MAEQRNTGPVLTRQTFLRAGAGGLLAFMAKAVQRCRIGRSESRLQHQGTEVKRMEKCGIPESEEV